MYSKKDPTEVPSYFLDSLADFASNVGGKIASGAGAVADTISKIPVVGDTLGDVVSGVGSSIGNISQGNFMDGLGNLYTAADTALGGVLPGGQAFSQGYLGNLYNAADKQLGGMLPGGVQAPKMVGLGSMAGREMAVPSAGMSNWDKAARLANIAKTGMGIYGLTQKGGGGGTNAQQYNRLIRPGAGTVVSGSVAPSSKDPAMKGTASSGTGGVSVPDTKKATGGMEIGEIKDSLNNINKEVDKMFSGNPTQDVIEGQLGTSAPKTPSGEMTLPADQTAFLQGFNIGNSTPSVQMPVVSAITPPTMNPIGITPAQPTMQSSLMQLVNQPDSAYYYDVNQDLVDRPDTANVIPVINSPVIDAPDFSNKIMDASDYSNKIIDVRQPRSSPYFTVVSR